jgi:hypothetical protein
MVNPRFTSSVRDVLFLAAGWGVGVGLRFAAISEPLVEIVIFG